MEVIFEVRCFFPCIFLKKKTFNEKFHDNMMVEICRGLLFLLYYFGFLTWTEKMPLLFLNGGLGFIRVSSMKNAQMRFLFLEMHIRIWIWFKTDCNCKVGNHSVIHVLQKPCIDKTMYTLPILPIENINRPRCFCCIWYVDCSKIRENKLSVQNWKH